MPRTGRPTTVGGKQKKVMFGTELEPRIVAWQESQELGSFSDAARDLVTIALNLIDNDRDEQEAAALHRFNSDPDLKAWIAGHEAGSVVERLAFMASCGDGSKAIPLIMFYDRRKPAAD